MAKPSGTGPRRFDWAATHARLANLQDSLTQPLKPDEVRQLLRQRAVNLAAAPSRASAIARQVDYITFALGRQKYAAEADRVAEVVEYATMTPLPGVPSFYLGLIGRAGAVFPLVDVRPLLGLARDEDAAPRFALVVLGGDSAVAIAATAIDGLQRLDSSALAVTAEGATLHPAILGTIADSLTVLDLSRLVLDARLTVQMEPRASGLN